MVDLKRIGRGSRVPSKPETEAALKVIPPLGWQPPPTLFGHKTIPTAVIERRVKNYKQAFDKKSTCTIHEWNQYVSFGIQDFESPTAYKQHIDMESADAARLRLARYYRNHLANNVNPNGALMKAMPSVENGLALSHPGFFDKTIAEMDLYLTQQPTPTPNVMDTDSSDALQLSSLAQAAAKQNETADTPATNPPMEIVSPPRLKTTHDAPSSSSPPIAQPTSVGEEPASSAPGVSITLPTNSTPPSPTADESIPPADDSSATIDKPSSPKKLKGWAKAKANKKARAAQAKQGFSDSSAARSTTSTPNSGRKPLAISHVLRIEARWAPKDYRELCASRDTMFQRLAPILSCFNNEHTWMMEWQTDQMDDSHDISAPLLSKYLSIRIVPVPKQKCFYFSFRMNGTGAQFIQVMASKIMTAARFGETITFDPSNIPVAHGELTFIGDILLKDAAVTHRERYLQYLRKEVLPPDTPIFDIKRRFRDAVGNQTSILTIRCGKSVSNKLAEILSNALNGKATPEVFLSRLAIGANQTSKQGQEEIYNVQQAFLEDLVYLPFLATNYIDHPIAEFLESGETILRTPRQWAKSLCDEHGNSIEAELENGGITDGNTVLMVPSIHSAHASREMQIYWKNQNPTLSNSMKLYADSLKDNPDIPKTVFTQNIDTLLAKKFSKRPDTATTGDDGSSVLTPASSLTGGHTAASKGSYAKTSIAWKVPLQDSSRKHTEKRAKTMTFRDLNQKKQIAILEAQLALDPSATPKRRGSSQASSRASSRASSKSSGLSASSAHTRLDDLHASVFGLDEKMTNIQNLLSKLTSTDQASPSSDNAAPSATHPDSLPLPPLATEQTAMVPYDPDLSMKGIEHFPPSGDDDFLTSNETRLTLLESPTKQKAAKKRRQATSPMSNSSPQYKESQGSGGRTPC